MFSKLNGWSQAVASFRDGSVDAVLDRVEARRRSVPVYPDRSSIFAALRFTPLDTVRVVIVGQDPYHGPGQAHGLAFSVPQGVAAPPTLRTIFREVARDVSSRVPLDQSTDLSRWACQGVLLLNTVLTVEQGKPGSHRGIGWEGVSTDILQTVVQIRPGAIFLVWGEPAGRCVGGLDPQPRHMLRAPHPSPLSAWRGFSGCGHFSRVNDLLALRGEAPIRW